jgi:lysophospholipid acyltransferase (LPLAT)-like uncharacterized protein
VAGQRIKEIMKIRNPVFLKVLGFAIAWFVRIWIGTVRFRYRALGPDVNPHKRGLKGRYIYAFWHETLLLPAYHYSRPDVWVLISQHADGEMIAQACRHLSLKVVRGSPKSRAVEALLELKRVSRQGHLVFTPDGPRGPRRTVQMGVVFLAAKTGLPIVPVGIGVQGAWRARSWDRFAVPRPFSAAACVIGEPIYVPDNVDKKQLELYRQQVQDAMDGATAAAERMTGLRDEAP